MTVTLRHEKTFCGERTIRALEVFLNDGKSQHCVLLSSREKEEKKKKEEKEE